MLGTSYRLVSADQKVLRKLICWVFFLPRMPAVFWVWAEDCPVHTGHSVSSALSVFGALSLCLLALHFFCFFPFRCLKLSLPSQKLKRCTFKAVSRFTHLPVIFNVHSSFSNSTLSTIFYHFHPFPPCFITSHDLVCACVHACERERQLEKARGRQPIIDVAGWRCKTWRQIQGLDQRGKDRESRRMHFYFLHCLFKDSGRLTITVQVVFINNRKRI